MANCAKNPQCTCKNWPLPALSHWEVKVGLDISLSGEVKIDLLAIAMLTEELRLWTISVSLRLVETMK